MVAHDAGARAGAFVGRERELTALRAGLEDARGGRGRVFLIGGEPGIGKSRLTEEFVAHAATAGNTILIGRCWEAGGAPPYWPWVECFRELILHRDAAVLTAALTSETAELAQLVPELRRVFPELPRPPQTSPETARFRLFEATAALLAAGARDAPLVLVLEDLHAADEPSLVLLRFLARRLRDMRVVVVGTYRDTEITRGHPLVAVIADTARESSTTRLSLRGLVEDQVASFIDAWVVGALPAGLAAAVYEETDGNPLFVRELVSLLAAEGQLNRTPEGSWGSLIPEGIRDVINLRLARLSDRCVQTLTLASVLGREFSVDLLERLGEIARPELLEVVDEAAAARMISELPSLPGRMRFSHQLIRDALYGELGPGQRAALHASVARALEQIHGPSPGALLAELAHHFYQAVPVGEAAKAVAYSVAAAKQAVAVLAFEEAVRLYGMAISALGAAAEVDEAHRSELLLGLGEAQARAGDAEAAKQSFLEAAEISARRQIPDQLASAALGYGGRFVWGRAAGDRRLVPLLERALVMMEGRNDGLRVRLLARLAGALRDEFNPARRDELSREALELARRLNDPAILAYVLDGRWAAIWGVDTTRERLQLADELIGVADRAGDGERSFQAHHYRMVCLLELGDIQGARHELATKDRIARELRQPAHRWYLVASRALLAIFEGRLDEGERLSSEALEVGERAFSAWYAKFTHLLHLFVIRRDQDRLGEIDDALRGAIGEYSASFPFISAVLALGLTEIGRTDEAATLLETLVDEDIHLPRDSEWLFGVAALAEVSASLNDSRRAAVLYKALAPYAERNVLAPIEAMTGSAAQHLGLLAATMGRWVAADRHFADALTLNRRMGAQPAVARTLVNHASALVKWGEPDARERAGRAAAEALEISRAGGFAALGKRIETLMRELGVEPAGAERLSRAFMFTDIVRSTSLVEAIGDDAWQDLRAWHDRALRQLFAEYRGEEVDHAGDGFFVAFHNARQALSCAIAVQRRLMEHRRSHGFAPQVRIGVHVGDARRSGREYSGRAVHEAARIGALAGPGEIVASASLLEEAGESLAGKDRRRVTIKGISQPIDVAVIGWARD